MVSLKALTSPPNERKTTLLDQLDYSSNKRKRDDDDELAGIFHNSSKSKSFSEIELQLESSPMPLEWQRCLDIQSGQIHFYNTRTQKRTTRDPRRTQELPSPTSHMSLELELNLPCDHQSQRKKNGNYNNTKHNFAKPMQDLGNFLMDSNKKSEVQAETQIKRCPSWLALNEEDEEQEEMVATVCTRCHMLVMLCKSSPSCPNCKFMHPPVSDRNSPNNNNGKLFKQRLIASCAK